MNFLGLLLSKKPFKSYDLKGFNSICISTGGERGTNTTTKPQLLQTSLFYAKVLIKSILTKVLLIFNV
jgi:hypothetical protein